MDRLGKVTEWNEARGFGFLAPVDAAHATGRVFFHVRAYDQGQRRPEPGELVKFTASRGDDGRWRATRVRRAVAPAGSRPPPTRSTKRQSAPAPGRPAPASALAALVLAYCACTAVAVQADRLPGMLLFWLLAANGLTLLFYYGDKTAAQRGEQRIPEFTLHLLELTGGWPAALLAQRVLRHKTSKASYRSGFRAMVTLHIAILAVLAYTRVLG